MAVSSSRVRAALAAAALACAPAFAAGADDEQVFMTAEEAVARAFPGGGVWRAEVRLSPSQRARVEKRLGWRLKDPSVAAYTAGPGSGYAVLTEEIGKHKPITFMVKATPDFKAEWVEVLVYREPHGSEVRRESFLRQFAGRRAGERLRPGREVVNITGATLSVRAVAAGVQRVLVMLEEAYGPGEGH